MSFTLNTAFLKHLYVDSSSSINIIYITKLLLFFRNILFYPLYYAVFVKLVTKSSYRNAEYLCGLCTIVGADVQCAQNQLFLGLGYCHTGPDIFPFALKIPLKRENCRFYFTGARENHRAFNGMFQLSDVARPCVPF